MARAAQEAKPKTWRDELPVHPAADLFPMMSEDELRTLGEDIKKNGLQEPITLYDDMILDGRNRYAACKLAGVEPTFRLGAAHQESPNLARLVISDPYAYVTSANIHRRHLTTEQRRELIAKLLKATPEKSDRQIAEQTETSPTTVGKVRRELEATGDVSKLDTRRDTKGREQQAHKPPLQITGTVLDTSPGAAATATDRALKDRAYVAEYGLPAVVEAVNREEVSVSAAVEFVRTYPPTRQDAFIVEARGSVAEAIRQAGELKAKADRACAASTPSLFDARVKDAADRAANPTSKQQATDHAEVHRAGDQRQGNITLESLSKELKATDDLKRIVDMLCPRQMTPDQLARELLADVHKEHWSGPLPSNADLQGCVSTMAAIAKLWKA